MPEPASGSRTPSATPLPVRVVDLDWQSVATVLVAFVGLAAVTGLVRSTTRTLAAIAVGGLIALALNPLVSAVQRRFSSRRGIAVGAVLFGFAAAFVAAAFLLVPPAVRQVQDLGDDIPRVVADLGDLPIIGDDLVEADAPARVERWLESLPGRLAGDTTPLEDVGRSVADGLLAGVLTLLLAVTLLLDGERLVDGARRVLPAGVRPRAARLSDLAYRVVGRYVAGSLLVATIAGLFVLVAGLSLGVPLTPLLALWVAMWDLIPQIGGAAGGVPFVALGFTQGVGIGLACAALFVIYLQLENHVISPLVVGQAVKLSPPATMTAALVGVSAGGVVGALLAVPLVGAAKAVYLELRGPAPGGTSSGSTPEVPIT